MVKKVNSTQRIFPWSILLYGLALGLLLAALQTARYRFWIFQPAQEVYFGLIAAIFTGVGIWAGYRLTPGRTTTEVPLAGEPLAGAALEQALEQLGITPREYEVLQCIARGMSNQEIAGHLFVSLNTIKTHTSNLFSKLGVQRRTQAVQKAQALGLLAPLHPKV